MNIVSAKFIKGIVDPKDMLQEGLPQIAFIGRSNVGKSSTINVLTKQKGLAKTSSFPGSTQQINVFVINNKFNLVDLPGYGFARLSAGGRDKIFDLINGYLFGQQQRQEKVVLIIDAIIGPTEADLDMLGALENHEKDVIIVLNKIDKIKKSDYKKQLQKIQTLVGSYPLFPFSAEKKIGVGELTNAIFIKK